MAYIPVGSYDILEDLNRRKEFYALKNTHKASPRREGIIPYFMLENELRKGNNIQLYSYQQFVRNFMNINTPYNRLLMNHSTGSGKTIGAIAIAMEFISYFRKEQLMGADKSRIGSVFIIAFDGPRRAFTKELLTYPEFGIVSREEILKWNKLQEHAELTRDTQDINNANDFRNRLKRKISNRKGNGFFEFMGYKRLVNRLFISPESLMNLSEEEIIKKLKSGKIKYNKKFLDQFKNSLVICDEIHNVYNSLQKNNWGIAIQTILDYHNSISAVFMSATPINNNPSEIVDLLNLLLPSEQRLTKGKLFNNNEIKQTTLDEIKKLSRGRVSYLLDINPKLYPSREFLGDYIKGVPYMKFIRTPINRKQFSLYSLLFNKNTKALSQDGKYILDFVLPTPSNKFSSVSQQVKEIFNAPLKWKTSNNIRVVEGNVLGEFLNISNLMNVSPKYYKMMQDIFSIISQGKGKIMIYHHNVKFGVILIKNILLTNGILDEYGQETENTICSVCGKKLKEHSRGVEEHMFRATRFLMAYGEIDKNTINQSINKFNLPSNKDGDNIKILLGSRVMKESYDLKAVRNLLLMSRPDNIPMFIQIIGRTIRKKSHILLDESKRKVEISIYVSSHPQNKELLYEELKYKEKLLDYRKIQLIEKTLHEVAIDAVINKNIVQPGLVSKDIGDLKFSPSVKEKTFRYEELNLSTFKSFANEEELNLVSYIIKRAFIEVSPVWTFDDLVRFVMRPSFDVEYDTTLIDINNIIITLSKLLWSNSRIVNMKKRDSGILDLLFNPFDKRLSLPSGDEAAIYQYDKYYMIFPVVENNINLYVDVPYREIENTEVIEGDVYEYLKKEYLNFNYKETFLIFKKKYNNFPFEQLTGAVCEYGINFHLRLIENCIQYIFDSWTDWSTDKTEFHNFYFKMLYYYDVLGLVIFADTAKGYIYDMYSPYILEHPPEKSKYEEVNKLRQSQKIIETRHNRNVLNAMARNIEKSACEWCPQITKELYNKNLKNSLHRFSLLKKTKKNIVRVNPDLLPIGHFISDAPRFYHPDRGYFESPEYIHMIEEWKENSIIIGYNIKSSTGIHVRFKLRKPIHKLTKHKDSRKTETGTICSTKSKPFLVNLSKQLNIKVKDKQSVSELCNNIKGRLMKLELIERAKGTRIKYFYSHFEKA